MNRYRALSGLIHVLGTTIRGMFPQSWWWVTLCWPSQLAVVWVEMREGQVYRGWQKQ